MRNTGWKEEFETADKYDKRRRILLWVAAIIFIPFMVFVFAAWASYPKQPVNSSNEATEVEPASYKYEELGQRCNEAITKYDSLIESYEKGLSEYSVLVEQNIAKITQQSQEYQDQLYRDANNAGPGINYTPVEAAARESREIARSGIANLNNLAIPAKQKMQESIDSNTDKRNQLKTCFSLTSREENIPERSVIDYETLITNIN